MTFRRVGQRRIEVSNARKLIFPEDGLRKLDVVDYYVRVAEHLLRHGAERPLTMHRFPDGIGEDGFYQQHRPEHFPDWLAGESTPRADGSGDVEHVVLERAADLAYLADQGCVALHGWLSRVGTLERPRWLVFDLDPTGEAFAPVRRAAQQVAALCRELEWTPFVMTTGSRGLHVVVALAGAETFDDVRAFARRMARVLASRHDDLTLEQRKAKRGPRLYLDLQRNAWGQTAILPYSLRARPGAPVATPIDWDELDSLDRSDRYRLENLFRRLGQKRDPWRSIRRHAVRLAPARERLRRIERDGPERVD